MNTSFSCSEARTPTKASTNITDFSLASLCSSVKKPPQQTSNNSNTSSISFAFDFKTDRDVAKNSTSTNNSTSLYSALGGYSGSNGSGGTSSSTTSSSTSYLSSNMDMIQSKIEYLERERVELAMQLHKRDEKDRDRKLRLETLETRLKHAEEDKSKAYQEAHEQREQVIRLTCEVTDLKTEIVRLNKEIQSTNRFEAMDVWKKMTIASRELKRCEEELNISVNDRAVLTAENNRLITENETLAERVAQLEKERTVTQEAMNHMQHTLQQNWVEIPQLKEENTMLHMQLQGLQSEYIEKIDRLSKENEEFAAKTRDLQDELNQQVQVIQSNTIALAKEKENDLEMAINDLKKKLMESETKRRKLHNQVQDLRGNIRVFVRCRPFLSSDGLPNYQELQEAATNPDPAVSAAASGHLLFHDDDCSLSVLNQYGASVTAKPHQFTFDHIFRSTAGQEDIYREVSDLVQSVMDGYRVCVFSYGQTGSGKTHTMTGSKVGAERGIIPRAIEELLQQSKALKELGWQISLNASIVELYNEDLRDLLANANGKNSSSTVVASQPNSGSIADKKEKYKIMRHDGRVVVSGLTNLSIPTDEYEEGVNKFQKLLDISSQVRTTAATGMNEMSSRSHLIVMIDVSGTYTIPANGQMPSQTKTLHGGLRLCDLAGSERLDRTNTLHDATRLKETVNINKSLSCLADVFLALSSKASHVPYRNSKLTMLLQDCLSGDGKSLMFVNVSPTPASAQETLCSLRFANQVSQVELGKAQKHMITTVIQPVSAPAQAPPMLLPHASVPCATAALMPPPPPVVATATTGPVVSTSSVNDVSAATPRPDRVKMRSSSFSAKLMQQPNFDTAVCKSTESTPTRPKLSSKTSLAPGSSNTNNSEPRNSDKKAVRFSTVAATTHTTSNTDTELPVSNRPLPVYSFLSGNQPERSVGTAPKVRHLGASRRNSVVNGPSLISAVNSAQRVKTAEASYLIHHPAAAASLVHHKENEFNVAATITTATRGHKRESVCPDLMGAKRLRSLPTVDSSCANVVSGVTPSVPEPWNSSTVTAGAGKKSTWR